MKKSFILMLRYLAISVLVCSVVAGCGGGNSTTAPSPAPLASTTRVLQPGDTWVYTYQSGQSGLFGKTGTTRTQTEKVVSRSDDGTVAYEIETVEAGARSLVEQQLRQSEAALPVYLLSEHTTDTYSDEPQERVVDRGTKTYPANYPALFDTWREGDTLNYTPPPLPDNSGGSENLPPRDFRIVGNETVTIPAGRFQTWKVIYTTSSSQSTIWYAPQIGNFVRWKADVHEFENPYSYELTLRETTVKPSSAPAT